MPENLLETESFPESGNLGFSKEPAKGLNLHLVGILGLKALDGNFTAEFNGTFYYCSEYGHGGAQLMNRTG